MEDGKFEKDGNVVGMNTHAKKLEEHIKRCLKILW